MEIRRRPGLAGRSRSPARAPNRFSAGTRQSVNINLRSVAGTQPSLFSFFPGRSPGVPFSTINAEIRAGFLVCVGYSHRHADIRIVPVGRKCFRAVDHPASPSARPRFVVPPASEPASGSVSDQHPSFSPRAKGVRIFLSFAPVAKFVNVIAAQRIVRSDDNSRRPSTRDNTSIAITYRHSRARRHLTPRESLSSSPPFPPAWA